MDKILGEYLDLNLSSKDYLGWADSYTDCNQTDRLVDTDEYYERYSDYRDGYRNWRN